MDEVPAPAERSGSRAFFAVSDELRAAEREDVGHGQVVTRVLRRLAAEGLLTPGDVAVRDARALGLGVLVDGRPVESERVHLVRPRADDTVDDIRGRLRDAMRREAPELNTEGPFVGPMLDAFAQQLADVHAELRTEGDGERRDVGSGPDLVSRMIDARDCLRETAHRAPRGPHESMVAALRWLDEGIREGMVQRELYASLRLLVAGEPHVCSCGGPDSCTHGRPAYEDRCRFEAALRSLLGADG